MKKIFKNKWFYIILGIILMGIIITLLLVFNKEETKTLKENTYTMYIKKEGIVKLNLKETYEECTKDKETKICSDKEIKVSSYEVIDGFEALDFQDLSLNEALELITQSNDAELKIITDYKNMQEEELTKKYPDLEINVSYEEDLDIKEVLNTFEEIYYTVSFDSDGGSSVNSVVVKENGTIEEPKAPTRDGYTFVEWQLNDKKYDFKSAVTTDLTLKAKWQKKASSNTTTNTNTTTPTNTNTNNNVVKDGVINLNANIVVNEQLQTILCGFGMFVTNYDSVFPSNVYTGGYCPFNEADCYENEVSKEDIDNKANTGELKFDSSKEANAKKILESVQASAKSSMGIYDYSYSIEGHRYSYSFYYLNVLDASFTTDGMKFAQNIKSAFASAKNFYGNCGGMMTENKVLTEELCTKYNLKCDRW